MRSESKCFQALLIYGEYGRGTVWNTNKGYCSSQFELKVITFFRLLQMQPSITLIRLTLRWCVFKELTSIFNPFELKHINSEEKTQNLLRVSRETSYIRLYYAKQGICLLSIRLACFLIRQYEWFSFPKLFKLQETAHKTFSSHEPQIVLQTFSIKTLGINFCCRFGKDHTFPWVWAMSKIKSRSS